MYKIIFLIIPIVVYAQSLKELIDLSVLHNDLVISKTFIQSSKLKELESKESDYYPTIDVGAFYERVDERSDYQAGDIYSGFAKAGVDIYDGGKKSALIDKAKGELKSSTYEKVDTKKSLALSIADDFFHIKSLEASLDSRDEAKKYLKAQLQRIEKFYEVELATKDDVDRLQASYDTNIYEIESIRFKILTLKKSLELKVGLHVGTLEYSSFKVPSELDYEISDSLKALEAKKQSLISGSKILKSAYYPHVRVEDTYSLFGYDRKGPLNPETQESQNRLFLSVNMRLFDFGAVSKSEEALLISSEALNSQINYKTKEQKMQYKLAKSRIQTNQIKIKSSKSALIAANSAFKTIEEKYNAGIVDYVVYLDALTSKTSANSLYETSLNDLELAYSLYYFYSGKNIKDYLK